jgi:glycosyltransferase involved in cell wall biosynthesis
MFLSLAERLARYYPLGALLVSAPVETFGKPTFGRSKLRQVSAPAYDRGSRFRRIMSWVLYTFRITRFVLFRHRGDVFLLVSNPPLIVPWVWFLSFFRNVQYAVLVYDIHPDVLIKAGVLQKKSFLASIWQKLNSLAYRRSSALITIGNRMAAVLQGQIGNHGPAVSVVPPWADVDLIAPIARIDNPYVENYINLDSIVVLYSGNMGASHDIDSILEAAKSLHDDSRIEFLLIGGGERFNEAVNFSQNNKLTNLKVLPWQPENLVKYTLPLADIALVALDEGMEDLMVPSKSFSYMAAGSALIAISNKPSELSDLLAQKDIGVLVPPRRPDLLVKSILKLVEDPGRLAELRRNSRALAVERYSREAGIESFRKIITEAGLMPAANA